MSLMVIDPYRFAAAVTPTIALTDSATDDDNLDTYTFADRAIGTASSTRLVVVGVVAVNNAGIDISGVTIGGSAGTLVAKDASGETVSGLYQRVVTSGTTAEIVVTASTTGQACGIAVWAIDDYSSSTATDTDANNGADPMTDLLNVSAGGVALAVAGCVGGDSASWTGLSEDVDSVFNGSNGIFTAASSSFATAQTNLTIGPDFAGSNNNQSIAMAAWR